MKCCVTTKLANCVCVCAPVVSALCDEPPAGLHLNIQASLHRAHLHVLVQVSVHVTLGSGQLQLQTYSRCFNPHKSHAADYSLVLLCLVKACLLAQLDVNSGELLHIWEDKRNSFVPKRVQFEA